MPCNQLGAMILPFVVGALTGWVLSRIGDKCLLHCYLPTKDPGVYQCHKCQKTDEEPHSML